MTESIEEQVKALATRAKEASRALMGAPSERKDAVLRRVAEALRAPGSADILQANDADVEAGAGVSKSYEMTILLQLQGRIHNR